jgi:hypothetical protein
MGYDDMTVDSVKRKQIYSVDPIDAIGIYGNIQKLAQYATPTKDTLSGFNFTQGGINVGLNPFTSWADITQKGNGLLGSIGKYQADENGVLNPPDIGFCWTA